MVVFRMKTRAKASTTASFTALATPPGAALGVQALEGGDQGCGEAEHRRLDQCHNEIRHLAVLAERGQERSGGQVLHADVVQVARHHAAEGDDRAQGQGHDDGGDQSRCDEALDHVETHDLHRVDFLADCARSQIRADRRTGHPGHHQRAHQSCGLADDDECHHGARVAARADAPGQFADRHGDEHPDRHHQQQGRAGAHPADEQGLVDDLVEHQASAYHRGDDADQRLHREAEHVAALDQDVPNGALGRR